MPRKEMALTEVLTIGDLKELITALPDDTPLCGSTPGDKITATISAHPAGVGSMLTFGFSNPTALGTRHPMGLVTTIGQCKKLMSPAGWQAFCKQRIADPFSPFDPADCADTENVFLTRQETSDYEYRESATR